MGPPRNPPAVMAWMSTLGAMQAYGTVVIRTCSSPCGFWGEVDLDHMIHLLGGPQMTLWDCEPPCPLCHRRNHFMASPSRGTPMRPLLSRPPDAIVLLPLEAWLAHWTGRRL